MSREEVQQEHERMRRLALEELKRKKFARKPRYPGQLEGDENRSNQESWEDRYTDNEIVEGDIILTLRSFMQRGK